MTPQPHRSYRPFVKARGDRRRNRWLAAMGLLTFVVGVFLIYNALAFSYTDRRELIRKLQLSGATRRELTGALLAELALFLLVGALLGWWLGGQLAAWLLPRDPKAAGPWYAVRCRSR